MNRHIIHADIQHLDLLLPLFEDYRSFYRMPSASEAVRSFLQSRLESRDSVLMLSMGAGDHPEGFVQLFPSLSSVRLSRHWILNDLFVTPSARRRGVGQSLISAAIEYVKSTGSASLELATEKTNRAARSLYESMGWTLDEEFDRYFFIAA
ncbi:MAG: GNAT family N-acetyltransferase [Rhodothermales bacterium]|nr:GNAT family N-acetyltransferase [Rhodothermales bacterium]